MSRRPGIVEPHESISPQAHWMFKCSTIRHLVGECFAQRRLLHTDGGKRTIDP